MRQCSFLNSALGRLRGQSSEISWGCRCPFRVQTGKAHYEHMLSALPLKADITLRTRYVRFVPRADVTLLNRLRSTAIDLRDNFARPRSRVTVAAAFLERGRVERRGAGLPDR